MKLGVTLRNMGTQSSVETMLGGATAAEAAGFESVWITDHIAIPPDDAEGSGGRYTDTLTTLAWLAGVTEKIHLGSGVLILPYRPILPTAKQVATIQELSRGRLLLGVGIGWIDPEFRALGVDRHQRGAISDRTLEFLNTAFANDEVELNGQAFLFKPRPAAPPILIGGRAPHALKRAIRHRAGWLPMVRSAAELEADARQYQALAEAANAPFSITAMGRLPVEPEDARAELAAYADLGVERFVCGIGYETLDGYQAELDRLSALL